jgi:hypothetical protein
MPVLPPARPKTGARGGRFSIKTGALDAVMGRKPPVVARIPSAFLNAYIPGDEIRH